MKNWTTDAANMPRLKNPGYTALDSNLLIKLIVFLGVNEEATVL